MSMKLNKGDVIGLFQSASTSLSFSNPSQKRLQQAKYYKLKIPSERKSIKQCHELARSRQQRRRRNRFGELLLLGNTIADCSSSAPSVTAFPASSHSSPPSVLLPSLPHPPPYSSPQRPSTPERYGRRLQNLVLPLLQAAAPAIHINIEQLSTHFILELETRWKNFIASHLETRQALLEEEKGKGQQQKGQ